MAAQTDDKKLNGAGLSTLWGLIKDLVTNAISALSIPTKTSDLTNDSGFVEDANYVHTDNNYTNNEKSKLGGVESGAQANVIEEVKVNNVAITPSSKSVNIPVPTDNSQIANGAGYQTAAQVNAAIDSKMQSSIKPKGGILFANLPTPSSSNEGWMWNMDDAFTIDNRFKDYESGKTKTYPKGTNVYVVSDEREVSGEMTTVYLFDVYQGYIDLSSYATLDDVESLSTAEIQSICV
jgi:hypothetical protein